MYVPRKREALPEPKVIHSYWQDQVNTNTEEMIDTFGIAAVENILDGGKQMYCYACGKEDNHLMRCHIVADSLGGLAVPENLFLMCRVCHQDNPDTVYKELFQHFVKTRDSNLARQYFTAKPFLETLYAKAESAEKALWDAATTQDIRSAANGAASVATVGLNNAVSVLTSVGVVWKRITQPLHTAPAVQ